MNRTDSACDRAELPCVTVVMPVYNGEGFLTTQIESILAQENVCVRLVIADDASTDGSWQLLCDLAASDPRIHLVRNNQNLGLLRTLARLLQGIETPYFALSDQDDIWDRQKLARSVQALVRRSAALVYSDVRLVDETGRVTVEQYLSARKLRPIEGRDPAPFVFRNPAIGHTMVGTKEVADLVGQFDPVLSAHEVWVIACACRLGPVVFLDAVLGSYRQHSKNAVGAQGPLFSRIWQLFQTDGRLALRQGTRARALALLSRHFPNLRPIAKLYDARGLSRWRGFPRFARFMLRNRKHLGLYSVLAEVSLYPFSARHRA
jgi:glycosyltransferase involved in cell wall biosynthesis